MKRIFPIPSHVNFASLGSAEVPSTLTEVEEEDWGGAYFNSHRRTSFGSNVDGYISSSPPANRRFHQAAEALALGNSEAEPDSAIESEASPIAPSRSLPGVREGEESEGVVEDERDDDAATERASYSNGKTKQTTAAPPIPQLSENTGEIVVFDYGVAVFLGFDESQERQILDDLLSVCIKH